MAEYIEREALMKYPIRIDHYDKEHGKLDFVLGIESVLEYAEALPAADVVEVVHAKWEYHGGDDDDELYGFCTNCHHGNMTEDDIERLKPRYCPNCGARMDGE